MTDTYIDPEELARQKAALRARMRATRHDLASQTVDAANRLAIHVSTALAPAAGSTVSGYVAMRDEIDPRPCLAALAARGCRIALPTVPDDGQGLIFRAWEPGEDLVPGPFGTSEPSLDAEVVYPDLLLIPLLAFDRTGGRLGYGGGFYDRTLAAMRGWSTFRAVGLAYAGQQVDAVPTGPDDVPLDGIVTETGFLDFSE